MAKVIVYGTEHCGYCRMAEKLLSDKGIETDKIDLTNDADARNELVAQTGQRTVPQIFIDDKFIGGFHELRKLSIGGKLERLINGSSEE